MPEHPIRPAEPEDLPALLAVVTRAYRGETGRTGWTTESDLIDGPRTSLGLLQATLASPDARILAAGRPPAGTVTVTRAAPARATLGMLAVDPALQTAGLGRALVAAAEATARTAFAAQILELNVLAPRAELIAWYARRGYAPTGETRPFPHGEPFVGTPRDPALAFTVLARSL